MSDDKKMTAGERRAAKRKEQIARGEMISGTNKGSNEPQLNPLDYTISLMRALNYYNTAYEQKEKRKWTYNYVGKAKAKELEDLSDFDFHSVGTIIRLKEREQPLQDTELNFIDTRIAELFQKAKSKSAKSAIKEDKVDAPAKPVVSIQDRIATKASEVAGEFDGLIDEYVKNDKDPDFASYLKANEISPQVSKLIPNFYDRTILELREALEGNDEQLVEAYSNFTKPRLRKLLKHYESIADACNQQVVSAKSIRKPRQLKVKPPSIIAKNVKYMLEFPELNLKSELPSKIVGSAEAWIYNTKTKKLAVYRSAIGERLSIKGTTIINYVVADSTAKTLRKPETLSDYLEMGKRPLGLAFKALKTKDSMPNGRINQDCIIFKVI
jgi:hypothetical protein